MNAPSFRSNPLKLTLAALAGLGLSGDAALLAQAPRAAAGVLARAAPLVFALEAQAAPVNPGPATGALPGLAGHALALRLATGDGDAAAVVVLAQAGARGEPIPGEPGAEILRPLAPAAAPAPPPDREAAVAVLDTRVLAHRVGSAAPPHDAFAPRSWTAPAPPPAAPTSAAEAAAPPPPPQAPPLPFKYLGLLEQGENVPPTLYLSQGEKLVTAVPGDVIDNTWRVDSLKGRTLHFTYLPLDQRLSLPLGSTTP